MDADERLAQKLQELQLEMPPAPEPKGVYQPLIIVGNLAHSAGHLPLTPSGALVTGRVGVDLDEAASHAAAVLAGLGILATLKKELGSLQRVRRVVKIFGMVNCVDEFVHQPAVINGCSQLFAEVFGEDAGIGVRSAIGVNSLPMGAPVEIEAVFEVE
jgi:enamine deaminase RidA (YjgF/YER057c/UK114 family)